MLNSEIEVKYSIDKGIYIKTHKKITKEDLDKVSREMKEIVKRNLPILKLKKSDLHVKETNIEYLFL